MTTVVTALVTRSSPAGAWDYQEHVWLGEQSYKEACEDIATNTLLTEWNQRNYDIACRAIGGSDGTIPAASLYGQATAIAADHLSNPDDFTNILASERAASFLGYVVLALKNDSHFLPTAKREWRKLHTTSVQEALQARQLDGLERQAAFEKAFYRHAFADHYLQDSYSAGHSGFARVASRPSTAGAMHDYFNRAGRVFLDRRGRRWFGLGDGSLHDPRNRLARTALQAIARASVRSFLIAFIHGEIDESALDDIWDRFPVMATGMSRDFKCVGEDPGADCSTSQVLAPVDGIQLSAEPRLELTFGYRGSLGKTGAIPIIGTIGMTLWGGRGGWHFEYQFGAVDDPSQGGAGILGLATGIERSLFRKFPYPISASLVLQGGFALVAKHDADGEILFGDLRTGAKLSLDVGKSWSLSASGGPAYSWSSPGANTPARFGWWWGASLERLMWTRGGGAR